MSAVSFEAKPVLDRLLIEDILAIADTKLVLGNWYAISVHNGKSLPDYAALLAIGGASFGHARALYQYLGNYGIGYSFLERGRSADDIRSMELLDAPPQSWADFIAGTFLAEQATWLLASGFLSHPDRALAGICRRIGEESYFHLKYATGWARIFAAGDSRPFTDAFLRRYPRAIAWFGSSANDLLHESGIRQSSFAELRGTFADEAEKLLKIASPKSVLPAGAPATAEEYRPGRRSGPLPARLYEIVRLRDPEAVAE